MSETKTAVPETTWELYRHRERPDIEFEVEMSNHCIGGDSSRGNTYITRPKCYGNYFLIRTVRNLSYPEEVHRPAFTYMPADRFLDVYERVG